MFREPSSLAEGVPGLWLFQNSAEAELFDERSINGVLTNDSGTIVI